MCLVLSFEKSYVCVKCRAWHAPAERVCAFQHGKGSVFNIKTTPGTSMGSLNDRKQNVRPPFLSLPQIVHSSVWCYSTGQLRHRMVFSFDKQAHLLGTQHIHKNEMNRSKSAVTHQWLVPLKGNGNQRWHTRKDHLSSASVNAIYMTLAFLAQIYKRKKILFIMAA